MIRSRSTIAFLLVTLAACSRLPANSVMAITGVTLIDVRDGSRIDDAAIVIEADRIRAAGAARDVRIPARARVVEARGKYVIPGLWDMHVHIQNQRELDVFFPLLVAHGIVGIRDCNGLLPSQFRTLGQMQRYQPHVFASGPGIDGPTAAGISDTAVVDELADKGADFIKVYSLLPRERFLAVLKRATARGLQAAGHVPIAVSAAEASDAGLRTMEHFDEILLNISTRETELRASRLRKVGAVSETASTTENRQLGVDEVWELAFPPIEPLLSTWSDEKARALFATFVQNGTWQTPTLELYRVWSMAPFDDPSFWNDSDLALMPKDWTESWRGNQNKFLLGKSQSERSILLARTKAWYGSQLDIARRMHQGGVRFLAGTDVSQWNYLIPGASLHTELARLVEIGLSPLEALQTATVNPAEYMGASDSEAIAPGKWAAFLILDADPLTNITNTRGISAVVLDGHLIDRSELDQMLGAARQLATAN